MTYYERNREARIAYQREYRRRNAEQIKRSKALYYRKNRVAIEMRRRLKMAGRLGGTTQAQGIYK